MATYAQIEAGRTGANKFVEFDYNQILDGIPDEYNPNEVWCRYMVDSPTGDPNRSSREIIRRKLKEYDLYGETQHQQYRVLQQVLVEKGCGHMIQYFNKFCSINVRGDETCRLMILAGGKINFDKLIDAVRRIPKNAKTTAEVTNILHTLTGQVNAAALNGVFTKWFCVSLNHGGNTVENEITQFYNQTIRGGANPPTPINIPTDPTVPFLAIHRMLPALNEADDDKRTDVKGLLLTQKKLMSNCRIQQEQKFSDQRTKK